MIESGLLRAQAEMAFCLARASGQPIAEARLIAFGRGYLAKAKRIENTTRREACDANSARRSA
jgi:hypothetical protein